MCLHNTFYHSTILKTITDELGNAKLSINSGLKNLFNGDFFKQNSILSDSDINALEAYNAELERGVSPMTAYYRTMQEASDSAVNMAHATGDATVNIEAIGTTTKAATVATKALAIAGNMLLMWGISKTISLAATAIDNYIHRAEKCKERVDEMVSTFNSAIDTANEHKNTIEEIGSRYEELSKGVNNLGENVSLTTDEYSEYNDICNQLAEMFPAMVQGYTSEGNAILNLKGNIDALTEAYEAEAQAAYNALIASGNDSDGNDIIADWKYSLEENKGKGTNITRAIEELQTFITSDMDAEMYTALREKASTGIYDGMTDAEKIVAGSEFLPFKIQFDLDEDGIITDEELAKAKESAKVLLQTYNAEIESNFSNVKTLANAYLMTNEDFKKLDEQSQSAASLLINSIPVTSDIAQVIMTGTKEKIGEYVNCIVQALSSDNPDVKNALINLLTLDTEDMSPDKIASAVDSYISTIADYLHRDENELKIQLGFEAVNNLAEQYQRVIEQTKDKFDGYDPTAFFQENSINTQEEIDKWLEIAQAANSAAEAEETYLRSSPSALNFDSESFLESVSAIQSGYETLLSAQVEFNEYGAITASTLKELMDNDLIQYLQYMANGLSINTAALENNEQALKDQGIAELYSAMCNDIQNLSLEDTSTLSAIAQTAIANLDSAATTAGENAAIAAHGWWEYSASIKSIPGVSDLTGDKYKKAEAIVNQYKNIANSISSISIGKTNSTNKTSSDSSSSSSADPLKEAFTQEYNTLKHNLEMEYITEKQYYDSLAALNKKYFAGKKEYLDDYRQYEEEVYAGLQACYKDYISSQMDFLEKQLAAGIISYEHYSSTVGDLLDTMYAEGKISATDYHDYVGQTLENQKNIYDKIISAVTGRIDREIDGIQSIIDGIEKQNDALEEQKTLMENAADAVVDYYDALIDGENDAIDALNEANDGIQERLDKYDSLINVADRLYESEQENLKAQQEVIQEKIDLLNDENDALDFQYRKEQALYELQRSQSQRTKLVYTTENGFVYQTDNEAISDAKKNVEDIKTEELISSLEKEQDALQESIDALQKYRDALGEISQAYQKLADERSAIELIGEDYENVILGANINDWLVLKDKYISANEAMADNEALIKSHEEKISAWEAEKENWSSLSGVIDEETKKQAAIRQFGADWERQINEERLVSFDIFKASYLDIQSRINDNTSLMESYEEKINYYENLKAQWSDIADVYEQSMENQYAAMLWGQDWEALILSGRLDTLEAFKKDYLSIQQAITDAAWKSANEQIRAAQEAQKGADGSTGSAGNVGGDYYIPTESSASWAVLDYYSKGVIKAGFSSATEAAQWATSNGYSFVKADNIHHAVMVTAKSNNDRLAIAKQHFYNSEFGNVKTDTIMDGAITKTHFYGSGTDNARKGLNLVGEKGTETYIDNSGRVSLITGPAYIPMLGGETVKNAAETKTLLNTVEWLSSEKNAALLENLNPEDMWQRWQSIIPDPLSMFSPDITMPRYDLTQIQNNTTPVVQNINLTLPNVTNTSGVEYLERELGKLPLQAVQHAGRL